MSQDPREKPGPQNFGAGGVAPVYGDPMDLPKPIDDDTTSFVEQDLPEEDGLPREATATDQIGEPIVPEEIDLPRDGRQPNWWPELEGWKKKLSSLHMDEDKFIKMRQDYERSGIYADHVLAHVEGYIGDVRSRIKEHLMVRPKKP